MGVSTLMKLPCEQGVWYILPSIRACLVYELMQRGLSQREVAAIMDLTPAAVCQYAAGKRGVKVNFGENVMRAIQDLAEDMADQQVQNIAVRMCAICTRVKEVSPQRNMSQDFGDTQAPEFITR